MIEGLCRRRGVGRKVEKAATVVGARNWLLDVATDTRAEDGAKLLMNGPNTDDIRQAGQRATRRIAAGAIAVVSIAYG
jgi:hypothetical protein